MSPSKLSRIETGKATPTVMDVERILTALGVSDELQAELSEAVRKAATEAMAWRLYRRTGFARHQDAIRAVEAETQTQRLFQPSCVPGLVQTPEYVRAILAGKQLTEEMLSRTVSARLERQRVLYRSGREFRFVITESVLRWRLLSAPEISMQLDRIISVSRLPNSCGNAEPSRRCPSVSLPFWQGQHLGHRRGRPSLLRRDGRRIHRRYTVGTHDKPGDDNGGSDPLPGQPWTPPAGPPSPDGGSPEGEGDRRK